MKLWHRVAAGFLEATILMGGILVAATVFGDAPGPQTPGAWAGIGAIWLLAGAFFSWLVHARSTAFRAPRGRTMVRDQGQGGSRNER